jgi:hypothetical protein
METTNAVQKKSIKTLFEEFILKNDHPCLMAQAVFRQGNYEIHQYQRLTENDTALKLLADLKKYLASYDFSTNDMFSFIAAFDDDEMTEEKFEISLWKLLQNLHHLDTSPWDPTVESDPDSANFSFSLLGKAFYIVGLHPNSSRLARKAPKPTLVFNLHHQFETLRKLGVYENTRDKIRERDMALQGNINPMLEDFGHGKEAPQYSGRKVDNTWKCPFHQQLNK